MQSETDAAGSRSFFTDRDRGGQPYGPAPTVAAPRRRESRRVLAGHVGFAALVKSRERTAPLWALMLATFWLDIVFAPLFLAHWESMEPVRGGYGGMLIHAPYTHSFLGMTVLSAALGAIFLVGSGRRVAVVVALVSASHWVLDLLVHRPDLPILPANAGRLPLLGLGLWNYPRAAACVELALVVAGAAGYWRASLAASASAGRSRAAATASAGTVAGFGLLLLFLDITS